LTTKGREPTQNTVKRRRAIRSVFIYVGKLENRKMAHLVLHQKIMRIQAENGIANAHLMQVVYSSTPVSTDDAVLLYEPNKAAKK
jgi:hypothetical protein